MKTCPYKDCTFTGTDAEITEHVDYCKSFGDPEHEESERR